MDSTKSANGSSEGGHFLCDDWFDPLETGVRTRIRGFIEELLEAELDAVLGRDRYERPRMGGGNSPIGAVGSRHGHRERGLMGTFGATTIRVPRARLTAKTKQEIEAKRKVFIRKWRLKCRAVADSLEEAGDRLFTFARFPESQWKSIRTTNAIERLHEEFKRRIKTQTVLPSAETAAMLFWALLASAQIVMRKVDGWPSLSQKPSDKIIDRAA
jgi:transposase-like protein